MHSQYPSVTRLPVHLEDSQLIVYDPEKITTESIPKISKTLLTEYFACNAIDEFARTLKYHEFPKHYAWKKDQKKWQRRKK